MPFSDENFDHGKNDSQDHDRGKGDDLHQKESPQTYNEIASGGLCSDGCSESVDPTLSKIHSSDILSLQKIGDGSGVLAIPRLRLKYFYKPLEPEIHKGMDALRKIC